MRDNNARISEPVIYLDAIDSDDITTFQDKYLQNETPVILKGMAKKWPALGKWSADFFKKHYGNVSVPVCYYKTNKQEKYAKQERMLLKEYISLAESEKICDGEPPYIGGWLYQNDCPELVDDVDMSLPCFPDNWLYKLPKAISLPPTNILIGYDKVSSPLHTDSYYVNSILTSIVGEKKARMVSPLDSFAVKNGQDLFDSQVLNSIVELGVRVYEGAIKPGDAFYIPPGWWHNVINCNFTIAVQNLHVDTHRVPLFEQQIRGFIIPILSKIESLGHEAIDEIKESNLPINPPLSQHVANFVENEKKYITFLSEAINKSEGYIKYTNDLRHGYVK